MLRIAVVLLALATAVIHIVLAIPDTLVMFYLNGLGYIGLTAAWLLAQPDIAQRMAGGPLEGVVGLLTPRRALVRWVLIAYTGITILGWVAFGERSAIGIADKLIEVALIGVLWVEGRR